MSTVPEATITEISQIVGDVYYRARSTPDGMVAYSEAYTVDDRKLIGRKRFTGETAHMDAGRDCTDRIAAAMYGQGGW